MRDKTSYQSNNWLEIISGDQNFSHTRTHTEAHFISLLFLRKIRNMTKNCLNNHL